MPKNITDEEIVAAAQSAEQAPEEDRESTPEERGDHFTPDTETPDAVPPVEAESAVEAEAEAEVEVEAEEQTPWIPKSRFDHVSGQLREVREELARLQQERERAPAATPAEPDAPAYDFDEAEERYGNAILDGDFDQAKTIRREIREQEASVRTPAVDIDSVREDARESVRVEMILKDVYKDYPELDSNSEKVNEDALNEALELQDAYIAKGMRVSAALTKAVDVVARLHSLGGKPPQQPQARKSKPDLAKVEKVASSQPPTALGDSPPPENSSAIDPANLSDEEWDALPDSTKAEMRGDYRVA